MEQHDSEYALLSTLFAFGEFLAAMEVMRPKKSEDGSSVVLDTPCQPMIRQVSYALSGENVDLRTIDGPEAHPNWELGEVKPGILQLLGFEQQEIGEFMVTRTNRIMEYKEFKKKWAQTRTNPEFRAPWTRLSNALKELQDMRDCYEFTPTEQVSVLKPEHSRRLVRKTS